MQENQFWNYQRFKSKIELEEFSKLLFKNKIEFEIEDNSINFDPTFSNNDFGKEFLIKLRNSDFEKVDRIQNELSYSLTQDIDKDHYLFDFTDQELIDIILKNDEWSKFDYSLAQKILKDRGKEFTENQLQKLKQQRVEELAKPEESQKTWIIVGYIFAFLGGFLGIFIGRHLSTHKKTLPNREKVFGYNETDRKHGSRIFFLGIVFLIIWVTIRILTIE
jgi:hypothetical protein